MATRSRNFPFKRRLAQSQLPRSQPVQSKLIRSQPAQLPRTQSAQSQLADLAELPSSFQPPAHPFRSRREIQVNGDDLRLIVAAVPILALFSFLFSALYADRIVTLFSASSAAALLEQEALRSRIYPVLVQQDLRPPAQKDQIRALSDVTAEGSGGITTAYGFHTLTDDDTLQAGKRGAVGSREESGGELENSANSKQSALLDSEGREKKGDLFERGIATDKAAIQRQAYRKGKRGRSQGAAPSLRIPFNYRFRQDFQLRYDGSSILSVARQQMVGYDYFRNMLRRIQESFSPPGVNYIFRDRAGYVINQPIKPQAVEVLFAIAPDGQVTDVRKVRSLGQRLVDKACIEALEGKNFGPPPAEVLERGNIFGIRFIFPPVIPR